MPTKDTGKSGTKGKSRKKGAPQKDQRVISPSAPPEGTSVVHDEEEALGIAELEDAKDIGEASVELASPEEELAQEVHSEGSSPVSLSSPKTIVVPNEDFSCVIGGVRYHFKTDEEQAVPPNVAGHLRKVGKVH